MKDITTTRDSIYEAQEWLNLLHHTNVEIPLVHPDGIYGAETTEAVRAFQRLYGLPETGDIDLATHNALYESALLARQSVSPQKLSVFPSVPGYIVKPGERSDTVAIMQLLLRLLSDHHDELSGISPSGYFDSRTESDLLAFQRLHSLPQTGFLDIHTWDALASAYSRRGAVS